MSPDIEHLLRDQLRGAAIGAPQHLGVDDQDVLTRGRRVVIRRRVLTVAGVASFTLVIAGTIGVLGPRVNNDALPAIPTPTVTPTPEATPTTTSSASPSTTVTATPTATPSSTPSATATSTAKPTRTTSPSSTPSRTKTPTPGSTLSATPGWSDRVTVAGRAYRARYVPIVGQHNYNLELESGGANVFSPQNVFNSENRFGADSGDSRITYYLGRYRITDLISIKGQPVTDEVIGHIAVPTPDGDDATGEPYMDLHVTIVRTSASAGDVNDWVVRLSNGSVWDLSKE
ncbi:hypothetical protein JNB_07504 [Janibacter sp. HTCC2649]|uniref:hypothetical protein n=1 Tax=Janibacter sp. HTCC2649 TaxID=313589 RepID=UPI0000670A17|nr:hypothetical protein [Janibacter sp. HTCC2649]EAP99998.1 hypothetical protein JNB_07504 [Janibacter sp. HTCC2649]